MMISNARCHDHDSGIIVEKGVECGLVAVRGVMIKKMTALSWRLPFLLLTIITTTATVTTAITTTTATITTTTSSSYYIMMLL